MDDEQVAGAPVRRGVGRAVWVAGGAALAVAVAAVAWSVVGREDPGPAPGGGGVSVTPTATGSVPDAETQMLAEIDAVLKARAAAVVAGRLPQYLATVDAKNAKLVQRDKQVFGNLRKLGLKQFSYARETEFVPEKRGAGWAIRLMMVLQIEGIDAAPRATPVGYTFAQRGGRWLLVADDELAGESDRGTYREPWDLGPIEVARGGGVLVVVPAGEGANARRLVQESREALPAVRLATRRAQVGILVVAMGDRRSMDAEWSTGGHPAGAVSVRNYSPTDEAMTSFKVTGSRIVINPTERTKADRFLLAHEFTHAVLSTLGSSAPTWLVEGFAMYVENRLAEQSGNADRVADWRDELLSKSVKPLVVLPIDGVFHGDYDEESYGVSWLIVEYLVTKYGLEKVNALYADLAKGSDDPAAREQTLRKHLKLSETALVAALKKYTGPS
ncbi:peptidase MA family metallohydrolase [Kribbella sp. CA-294648]|uniref:peptidase MA family metallohydrolase n=1 Tax=Kribbella sp. CA-294648 TaxID=3239948 RepID=UPI003D8FCC00